MVPVFVRVSIAVKRHTNQGNSSKGKALIMAGLRLIVNIIMEESMVEGRQTQTGEGTESPFYILIPRWQEKNFVPLSLSI